MSTSVTEAAPDLLLRGRTALITGASKGIGRETALRLAAEGVSLVLVARESAELTQVAEELRHSATTLPADLALPDEVQRVAAQAVARIGTPDIVVNNAGAFFLGRLEEIGSEQFDLSLRLNVLSPFLLSRAFLPEMRRRGSGHIVSVGSVADRHILTENAAYASTKFGLRALHEVLRLETRGSGVRATLVSPGAVDTRLWDPIDPDHREGFTPRASMLDPASVADAIVFALTRPQRVDIEELRLSRT